MLGVNVIMLRVVSWNVNGIRACLRKGLDNALSVLDADIVCVQETKMGIDQVQIQTNKYFPYWNSAAKKGYSGTAIFSKIKPEHITYGILGNHDSEGRVITAEYTDFFLVNCYAPHSRRDLSRLDYKVGFNKQLRELLIVLGHNNKPVILCGDLNVAHQEIDLRNSKANVGNAGFTDIERHDLDSLIGLGFLDSFRYKYPQKIAYSWWSYREGVRTRNIGWRIDYCLVSHNLKERILDCYIFDEIQGSDHCPIGIDLELKL